MATRIIAGYLKNKKIAIEKPNRKMQADLPMVRPTSERAREALFSILGHRADLNRPRSKLASGSQVLGAHGTENRSVLDIHEDLSTGVTTQLAAEVEFRKRSNGCHFLDVCAGSGAIGFEAISRGAEHVTFIEISSEQMEMIKYNANALGINDKITLLAKDATKLSNADRVYDVVFIDPPYADIDLLPKILSSLRNGKWIDDNTVIVLEHSIRETVKLPEGFEQMDQRKYGICSLVICKFSKEK